MLKVSNRTASIHVENKEEFKGNNTFAVWKNKTYKVYSFGYHFPILVFKKGKWYRNIEGYSKTTRKHKTQLTPINLKYIEVDTKRLKNL